VSARRYLEMLRAPPIGYLLATSIVARLPNAMTGLALALMISAHGSYAGAGAVVSAYVAGAAVAAPLLGRAVDRFGRVALLRPLALADAVALIVLSRLPVGEPVTLAGVAVLAGVLAPPINAASRSLWPVVVTGEARATIYAMDATFQEVIYIVGPSLVAVLTALGGARTAVAVTGLLCAVGTLAFAAHPAVAGAGRVAHDRPATGRRWRLPVAGSLLGAAALVVGGFSTVELATVAFARQHGSPALAGAVLVAWSAGSLSAGLGWGMRAGAGQRLAGRLVWLVALLAPATALPALAGNLAELAGLLFVAGLAIAPAFAVLYGLVAAESAPGRATEAFGWLSTGFLVGAAGGAAAGGALVQFGGPRAGYLAAGGLALLALPGLAWHAGRNGRQVRKAQPAGAGGAAGFARGWASKRR
jgi:MFS family permease